MEITNLNLNSIDKTYNVFTTEKNITKDINEKKLIDDKTISNDINYNFNKIDNNNEEIKDINSLLKGIKSSIESGTNADIFSNAGLNKISDLLK